MYRLTIDQAAQISPDAVKIIDGLRDENELLRKSEGALYKRIEAVEKQNEILEEELTDLVQYEKHLEQ